jgi:hypothetical protein
MVARPAVIAAATALAAVMCSDAAAQQVWKHATELGTPAALRLELEYQEPADLFSRLEGTLVFPLLVTASNISTQPLALRVEDLQLDLGNNAGTVTRLRPIDAKTALDMIRRDVRMSDLLGVIAAQGGALARNPYSRHLTDLRLGPGQRKQGYVFFVTPPSFRFNGFMAISTPLHKPELVATSAVGVETRTRGTGIAAKITEAISRLPGDVMYGRPFGRSYALLFGVSKYATADQLPGAALDLARMKAFLTNQGFDQVVDLPNQKVTQRTLSNVQAHFENRLGPEDRLLVYYSGHGEHPPEGGEAYLLLSQGTRIPMRSFVSWMRKVQVKHLLVLLDTCYSGDALNSLKRSPVPGGLLASLDGPTRKRVYTVANEGSRFVITAGGSDERVHEHKRWNGGLFTEGLLRSLRSNSARKLGVVTTYQMFADLKKFVQDEVAKYGLTSQTPLIDDLGVATPGGTTTVSRGEFVFIAASL